jgi:MSHA biogenesis protein MshO
MFIRAPVQGYADSARRAELTDIADTALRRMARDVRTAVPNSVRPSPAANSTFFEFVSTQDGGRYQADTLNLDGTDKTFVLSGTANVAAGDYIVMGSTQSDGSVAYRTDSSGGLRLVNSVVGGAGAATGFTLASILPAAFELSTQRFFVVDSTQQAVTYACEGTLGTLDANNDGQGRLVRHWMYWVAADTVHAAYSAGGSSAMLANKISACEINYGVVNQRFGLLAIRLTFTSGGESVTLYNEIHVNNAP